MCPTYRTENFLIMAASLGNHVRGDSVIAVVGTGIGGLTAVATCSEAGARGRRARTEESQHRSHPNAQACSPVQAPAPLRYGPRTHEEWTLCVDTNTDDASRLSGSNPRPMMAPP